MPIPTVVTDLSATAASNSPASTESPGDGDDYIRALSAFVKQSYDGTLTNLFRVNASGVPYGTAIHNPSGTLTGTTNQLICSGTYTPTLSSDANVESTTSAVCQWTRVGNVVTVSGSITVNPTSATTLTEVGVTLPIASAFTSNVQLRGTAVRGSTSAQYVSGIMFADTTNDRATLRYYNDSETASQVVSFTFGYVVV